jgi:hypothetical protein
MGSLDILALSNGPLDSLFLVIPKNGRISELLTTWNLT